MTDKFHKDAHLAMASAFEESAARGQTCTGSEHILLGLMTEGAGIAEVAVRYVGLSRDALRVEVSKVSPPADVKGVSDASLSSEAKNLLQVAWDESRQLGDGFIGTEHLVLAILRDSRCSAHHILTELAIDRETLRTCILQLVQQRKLGVDISKLSLPISSPSRPALEPRLPNDPELLSKVVLQPAETEGFSLRAKQVLQQAAIEAAALDWPVIRPIHIVMGLFADPGSIAVQALEQCEVTLEKLRVHAKTVAGLGPGLVSPEIKLMDDSISALLVARTQAERRGKAEIEPEHILFGVAVSISLITQGGKLLDTLHSLMGEDVRSRPIVANSQPLAYETVTVQNLAQPESLPDTPRTEVTDWFSDSAIEAMVIAIDEARRLGHTSVDRATILLALTHAQITGSAKILQSVGLTPEAARSRVTLLSNHTGGLQNDISQARELELSPAAKHFLELSWRQAAIFGRIIKPEHFLLAMLKAAKSADPQLLDTVGLDIEKLKSEIFQQIDGC